MRLSVGHGVLWTVLALITGLIAVRTCQQYNELAGTDLSPGRITLIAISVVLGPMAGLVANPQSGDGVQVVGYTILLLLPVLASTSPFLLVRREVNLVSAALCWAAFAAASVLWFASALVSLGFFLS